MNTRGSFVRFANVSLLRQVRFAQYSTAHRSVTPGMGGSLVGLANVRLIG
jgi:hypothetical protein